MLNIMKWIGTICFIVAATCRAFDFHFVDMLLSIVGALIWTYAAYVQKDGPLFASSAFCALVLTYGITK